VLTAAAIGTGGALGLAALGPAAFPGTGLLRCGPGPFASRDDSWLRTVYAVPVDASRAGAAGPNDAAMGQLGQAPVGSVSDVLSAARATALELSFAERGMATLRVSFPAERSMADAVESGWPWRAVGGARWTLVEPGGVRVVRAGYVALAPGGRVGAGGAGKTGSGTPVDERWVALTPLWPGLIADAAAWSAAAWILLAAPAAARRALRRRRGGCGACGYDLRGTPAGGACPECGAVAPGGREG
jgi:hypothetical protein